MIVGEVTIRMECEVLGGPTRLVVEHRGIGHPNGVIALCSSGIQWALQQMAMAEEAAKAKSMEELKLVGPDGKPIVAQ